MNSPVISLLRLEWRQMRLSPAFKVITILSIILGLGQALLFKGIFLAGIPLKSGFSLDDMRFLAGLGSYPLSFLIAMTLIWAFGATLLARDKASGTIDILMACPLSPYHILMAKGLLLSIPSTLLSVTLTLPSLLIIEHACRDIVGGSALTAPVLLNAWIILPVLFLCLTLVMTGISFISNGDISILPSFIMGFGMMILIPIGIKNRTLDISAWSFSLLHLMILGILLIILFILLLVVNKEKIVLSHTEE